MKLKIKICGPRVHNVGYRYFMLNEADNLGIKGFSAKNMMENGHQVLVVFIDGEVDQISSFRTNVEARHPEAAEVSSISIEDYDGHVEGISRFSFKFQSLQVSKGINSIIRIEKLQETMLATQEKMLEKQDKMLEKQDKMLEKQDKMLEKQDKMLEKQDKMIEKLEEARLDVVTEIRSSTDTIVSEMKDARECSAADTKELRIDLKSYLDDKLGRMEEDIARIKAKIGM